MSVSFEVERFTPGVEKSAHWQHYEVEVSAGMTVLDGLTQIREQIDPTLAWRSSCRMGICGSCGMVINGKPGLACNTQILSVSDRRIRLRPLANFSVSKDLVVDFAPMFEKHRAVRPYVIRVEDQTNGSLYDSLDSEYEQQPEDLIAYLQFADCIKCGVCMSACPTVAIDDRFLGPMPLTAVHRYNADSRDDGSELREAELLAHHAVWHCHYAAECSRVCPKGVDPARAIQLARRNLVMRWLGLKRTRSLSKLLVPETSRKRQSIPVPPFTWGTTDSRKLP